MHTIYCICFEGPNKNPWSKWVGEGNHPLCWGLSLSADSPFRATPPPRPPAKLPELPPKKEQPQEPANDEPEKLEDKEEPNKPTEPEKEAPKVNHEPVKPTEPEKEAPKVNHDPVKPTDPEKEEPEKEAPKPPEDPKGPANDEDPKKPDYDWVLMHDNTVCRRDKSDPIIWPHNKKLQTLTLAHICIVEPCAWAATGRGLPTPKSFLLTLRDETSISVLAPESHIVRRFALPRHYGAEGNPFEPPRLPREVSAIRRWLSCGRLAESELPLKCIIHSN